MPCWIWKQELVDLQEEYEDGYNISIRVAISDIEPTVQNCEPCGTNMIPYPLSTSSNCGDPMYFSFNCNTTSEQVSFNAPSGTYRVTSIDQNTTKFFIQVKDVGSLRLNHSLPFNQTTPRNSSSNVLSRITDDVEIVWEPPPVIYLQIARIGHIQLANQLVMGRGGAFAPKAFDGMAQS
ncbi:hypothetical protein ACB092_06G140900 [Castanea dentata]